MVNHSLIVNDPMKYTVHAVAESSWNSHVGIRLTVPARFRCHVVWRDFISHEFREGMVVALLHLLLNFIGIPSVFKRIVVSGVGSGVFCGK